MPVLKLAMRRLRKRRAIAAAQMLAMGVALGVPVALQLVSTIAGDAGYQGAIGVNDRRSLVTIERAGADHTDEYRSLQTGLSTDVSTTLGDRLIPVAEYARVPAFAMVTLNGRAYGNDPALGQLTAVYYPALEHKVELAAGTWPALPVPDQPIPVTMSRSGVDRYGFQVGDVFCIRTVFDTSGVPPLYCLRLAGIWRARDASDPFWLAAAPSTDLTFTSPGFLEFQKIVRFVHSVAGRAYRPNPQRLSVDEAPALYRDLLRLRGVITAEPGGSVFTNLDRAVAAFLGRAAANAFPVQLVAAEVIVVVLYGLAFVTQGFLASQEQQSVLWRIRGWSRGRLAFFLALQFLVLALPALVLAAGIALLSSWLVASSQHAVNLGVSRDLPTTLGGTLAFALVGVLAVCIALVLRFAGRGVATMRRAQGRGGHAAWWRSRRADLILAPLAVPILAEASLRDQAAVRSAQGGSDLVGLLLPILGLGLLAMVALRLLPLVAGGLLAARPGLAGRLAGWRLARHPAEHAGVALLLSLTLAVGVFASVYDATETSNALDRAAYATGADVRLSFKDTAGLAPLRAQLRATPGITSMTPVLRQSVHFTTSSDSLTVLGVDPATFARTAWSRPDLTRPPLEPALRRLTGVPGALEIPGQPSELRLWVHGLSAPGRLDVDLRDSVGAACTCTFGSVDFSGWRQLRMALDFAQMPRYPLQLRSLRVQSQASAESSIALSDLESGPAVDPTTLIFFSQSAGWTARDSSGLVFAPGPNGPARAQLTTTEVSVPASGAVTLQPPPVGGPRVLLAEPTLARLGLKPGNTVGVLVLGREVRMQIAGVVDYVPTLYPSSDDFMVMPLEGMVSALAAVQNQAVVPNELWLATTAAGAEQAKKLGPTTNIDFVVERAQEQAAALSDPVLIQLRANLAIGFACALMLAVLGFAVHFVIASRRRLAEHAILQANGLEPDDIRRGIALEQSMVAVFAGLSALFLAGVAIFVLLPGLQLGSSPADLVPPTVLRLDLARLGLGVVGAATVTLVLAWLTRGLATQVDVVDELRKLG